MDIRDALVSFLAGESLRAPASSVALCLEAAPKYKYCLRMSCRAGLATAQESTNASADAPARRSRQSVLTEEAI